MKKSLLLASLISSMCLSASANDFGVTGIGGTYMALKGEHADIQMVRESVRIDVYKQMKVGAPDRYYDTNVDFVFKNHGKKTTVEMAFPEFSDGQYPAERSNFRYFRTFVNGKNAKEFRVVTKRKSLAGEPYEALRIKKVRFASGETKRIRVSYRSEWGSATDRGSFASYYFTGGNWKGKVLESRLSIYFHNVEFSPVQAFMNKKPFDLRQNNNSFSYIWKNWEANGAFRFWFAINEEHTPKIEIDREFF